MASSSPLIMVLDWVLILFVLCSGVGVEVECVLTSRLELNFLACALTGGYYSVYLQTGSDVPAGLTCSNYQTLHLPCLC